MANVFFMVPAPLFGRLPARDLVRQVRVQLSQLRRAMFYELVQLLSVPTEFALSAFTLRRLMQTRDEIRNGSRRKLLPELPLASSADMLRAEHAHRCTADHDGCSEQCANAVR